MSYKNNCDGCRPKIDSCNQCIKEEKEFDYVRQWEEDNKANIIKPFEKILKAESDDDLDYELLYRDEVIGFVRKKDVIESGLLNRVVIYPCYLKIKGA